MNDAKRHELVEEWKKLKKNREELDIRLAQWCHAVRAEFATGDAGDMGFHRWLDTELGIPTREREALLDMARAFKIVPDPETWKAQGPRPAAQIRPLVRMPPKERVAILSAAKVEGRKIGDVIRARDRAQAARVGAPVRAHMSRALAEQGDAETIKRWACQLSADALANALAEQIADGTLNAPAPVVAAAKRRVAVLRRAHTKKAA